VSNSAAPRVTAAVVDYGLGNLFSVRQACEHAGMDVVVTARGDALLASDVVILPGVGAFGDAMATLRRLDLVSVLRDIAVSDRPLIGICLGIQLLMRESHEFGVHQGLGVIDGNVVRLGSVHQGARDIKVPQVQWNRIFRAEHERPQTDPWAATPLAGVTDGEFMYFAHSYHVKPADPSVTVAVSRYGDTEFCAALGWRNVFASQFHPERSGGPGLQVYRNIAMTVGRRRGESAA
jgi:glutamine amidotransferase